MALNSNISFESDKTWDNYDEAGRAARERVPEVLKAIPSDVRTIIDIGCGNGLITNIIGNIYNVTGVDISETALKTVKTRKIRCSSTKIDLPDHSYDLVLSNELLEHLNERDIDLTASEMMRLSKRYILLTVPFNENLDQSSVKCPECGYIFHIVGHLRSFQDYSLIHLFEEQFEVLEIKTFGRRIIRYNNRLLKIRQKYADQYYNPTGNTICPNCKNTNFKHKKGNVLSKVCNGINRIIGKRQAYWMMMLLERKSKS